MSDATPPPAAATTPPPAWYPDPTVPGQQRYWDGSAWTDHTAPTVQAAPTSWTGAYDAQRSASFGQRFAALVVDGLITFVGIMLVIGILFGIGAAVVAGTTRAGGDPSGFGIVVIVLLMLLGFALMVVAPLAYGAGFEGPSGGRTIGKWVLGIHVIEGDGGGTLTLGKSWLRQLVKSFASGQVVIGYLWMLWDDRDRTWHDMAATSLVVVDTGPKPSFGQLLRSFSPFRGTTGTPS